MFATPPENRCVLGPRLCYDDGTDTRPVGGRPRLPSTLKTDLARLPCSERLAPGSVFGGLLLVLSLAKTAWAEPPTPAGEVDFFERKIRPVLAEHCFQCHSQKQVKGGLRLDSRDGWVTGGDSGPAVIPGKPEDSPMLAGVALRPELRANAAQGAAAGERGRKTSSAGWPMARWIHARAKLAPRPSRPPSH